MSVINTMLKDLERRGVHSGNGTDHILGGLSASRKIDYDNDSSRNIYLMGLFGLAIVLTILVTIYYLSPYKLVSASVEGSEQKMAELSEAKLVLPSSSDRPLTNNPIVNTKTAQPDNTASSYTASANVTQSKPVPTQPAMTMAVVTDNKPVLDAAKPDKQVSSAKPVKQKIASASVSKPVNPVKNTVQKTVALDAEELDDEIDNAQLVNKQRRDFTPDEKSRQAYATALDSYNQGNKQASKTLLIEALNFSASNADASRLLAVIYLEDGRLDVATEVIESGLIVHPEDQTLLRLYLQPLVQTARYQDAIIVMENRLKLTSPDDLGYLAGLYQKNNDHLNAIKMYGQALKLIPSKSVWWMGQGISFEVIGQYKEALQSYQQSISTGQLSGKLAEYAISRVNLITQHKAASIS